MKTQKRTTIKLSFDGFGFNDANNEYGQRIATLSNYGLELGKESVESIVRAANNHDRLLELLKSCLLWHYNHKYRFSADKDEVMAWKDREKEIKEAIKQAEA